MGRDGLCMVKCTPNRPLCPLPDPLRYLSRNSTPQARESHVTVTFPTGADGADGDDLRLRVGIDAGNHAILREFAFTTL